MRNTAAIAAELAERFLIGTGIACVLIVAAGDDSHLSVNDASAHGAEGHRVWFANTPTANRTLAKMLTSDRRTAKASDGPTLAASVDEADAALMQLIKIDGLAKTSVAELAERLATITVGIFAVIGEGDIKKLNRNHYAIVRPRIKQAGTRRTSFARRLSAEKGQNQCRGNLAK